MKLFVTFWLAEDARIIGNPEPSKLGMFGQRLLRHTDSDDYDVANIAIIAYDKLQKMNMM